jgi:hypothetical protein
VVLILANETLEGKIILWIPAEEQIREIRSTVGFNMPLVALKTEGVME